MDNSLIEKMRVKAHFVAGKEPRIRNNDPIVEQSVENATKFLEKIENQIDLPSITSGTTADPEVILKIFWHVRDVRNIYGVFIEFKLNNRCDVTWIGPDNAKHVQNNIDYSALINLNVPEIFRDINTKVRVGRNNPTP